MLQRVLLAAALLAPSALAQSPTGIDPAARIAPAVHPPTARGPSDLAFGYDARYSDPAERGFVSFQLDAGLFPTNGPIFLAPDGALVQGCDFDDIDLTTLVCISAAGGLFSVDLDTETVTEIGAGIYDAGVVDLTYSVIDDAWFALASSCTSDGADDRSALYRVDPATGAATAVGGGTETSFCGLGLASDRDGLFFAYSAQTQSVVSRAAQIDPESGEFDILGPTGFDAYYAQSMDCDASDGECYAFGYVGSGENGLYRLNPASGFLASIGELPEGAELTAAAIATTTSDVVASESAPADGLGLHVLSATPARGSLRLAVGAAGRLDATDALGRRIHSQRAANGATVTLDVSRWAPGVYVLRLSGDGVAASRTVTVVR